MNTESPVVPSPIDRACTSLTEVSLQTSSSRCAQCNARRKENGRNLVVCIDGTSNEFGENNTNVVKLYQKIDQENPHREQHTFYSGGIGTGPKSTNVLGRAGKAVIDKLDMAVAMNVGDTVKEAYGWLARTYQEGDQIYLFGFSRGAFQVRVLAAMIYEVGLIKTPTEKQIGTAYDHYEALSSGTPEKRKIANDFRNTFSWKEVRTHFVGVWDTVSSVGLIRGNVSLSTSSSASHACHFRHALALDELRVKFLPEYLHETNSQVDDEKPKPTSTAPPTESPASSTIERRGSTLSRIGNVVSRDDSKPADIKEVWFAGCHSDVGGTDRPDTSYHSGNVSLLWMRREAAENGLVLHPTDVVWVPGDIDFGMSDSMTQAWRVVEYIPIKHQVSFKGAGEDARRIHGLQPRRIIPGQKVHASILYANAYKPRASLGGGFDIPVVQGELDVELDDKLWETALFEDTAAWDLVARLSNPRGVEPIYTDGLLFMLRFKEGRKCIRNVPDWQNQLTNAIQNGNCTPFVRLVALAAYYETSCDDGVRPESPTQPHVELSQKTFDELKKKLAGILSTLKHKDGPRVVALLRPLTRHRFLREHFLTKDILEAIMKLLDEIIKEKGGEFGLAMDGFSSLLQCEDTQKIAIEKLGANYPFSKASRLSRMLDANDTHVLVAALRMVTTLVRLPEARHVCSVAKARLKDLAKKDERLVSLMAVEILLFLHDPNDREQLNIRDSNVGVNLSGVLVRLNKLNPADGQGDLKQEMLRRLFSPDSPQLGEAQMKIIEELISSVQKTNAQVRTSATFTLLKLCEVEAVRNVLRQVKLLDVFIDQLRSRDSAIVAAYALATCLKYSDMKESIQGNDLLPKNIVGMLQSNYFDDAVGESQGFQIFSDLMQHAELREKIKNHSIIKALSAKLAMGKSKETRVSLICMDILRSFDKDGQQDPQVLEKYA